MDRVALVEGDELTKANIESSGHVYTQTLTKLAEGKKIPLPKGGPLF